MISAFGIEHPDEIEKLLNPMPALKIGFQRGAGTRAGQLATAAPMGFKAAHTAGKGAGMAVKGFNSLGTAGKAGVVAAGGGGAYMGGKKRMKNQMMSGIR